ncbi:MAG: Oligopeptide-binding protein AppA [Firmicutes bacterium]|nr:Oligopeptide-binding protein AppA [Bacillota bacterium]
MSKRILFGVVAVAMIATLFIGLPMVQANVPIRVLINGAPLALAVPPVIQNGRTLVPMRAIFEALGATVNWDDATSTVTAYRREQAVVLTIGNRTAWVNGPSRQLDVPPVIVGGRTMVPLRFVAEALGAEVAWQDTPPTVTVTHTPYVAPTAGGTLTFGSIADPVVLNSILSSDTASGDILGRINWGLIRSHPSLEPINAIADRWSWDQATLTWRFWLNPNAKWHDGTAVTARDVKFTFDTIADPGYDGPRRPAVTHVQEIVVVSPQIVDFKMRQVDAGFLFNTASLGLIPHHILGNVPAAQHRAHATSRNPVGNGPFTFVRWVSGQFVELARNPNFFQGGGRPYIQSVITRTYPDINVMQAAWENGDIDWFGALLTDHIDRIMREHANRATFRELANHAYDYMSFSLRTPAGEPHPILSDRAVREALVVGLDRRAMVDTVLDRRGRVIHSHQVPSSWATGAQGLNLYEHSAVRARQMLDAAGWRVPTGSRDGVRMKGEQRLRIRLMTNAGNAIRADIAALAESYWKRIGVELVVEIIEWSVMLDRFSRSDYDLVLIGWALGLDPDPFSFFHSTQAARNAAGLITGFNRGQFINADVDRLLEAGRATMDIAERRRIYRELDVILNRELPYIWIFQRSIVTGVSNRVQNITWGQIGSWFVESWSIRR